MCGTPSKDNTDEESRRRRSRERAGFVSSKHICLAAARDFRMCPRLSALYKRLMPKSSHLHLLFGSRPASIFVFFFFFSQKRRRHVHSLASLVATLPLGNPNPRVATLHGNLACSGCSGLGYTSVPLL